MQSFTIKHHKNTNYLNILEYFIPFSINHKIPTCSFILLMGYKHNQSEIVEKGIELFRQKGYHNIGINEILQHCEIPKGSFYNFFKSKEEYACQVIDAYGVSILKLMESEFSPLVPKTPLGKLNSYIQILIKNNEIEGCKYGCLVHNLAMELGGINEKVSKRLSSNYDLWITRLATLIEQGQLSNQIRKDYDAYELAQTIQNGEYGALVQMKIIKNKTPLDKWWKMTLDCITENN